MKAGFVMAGIGILVLLGLFFLKPAGIDFVYLVLLLLLVLGTTYIMVKRTKDVKKGLAVADELAKKVSYKAAAFAYYITIWGAVGALWYNGPIKDWLNFAPLTLEQLVGIIVLGSGVIYFALYFYFNSKGDL